MALVKDIFVVMMLWACFTTSLWHARFEGFQSQNVVTVVGNVDKDLTSFLDRRERDGAIYLRKG
jgi:hypothetical protein